jgi:hypothetical protein
MPTLGKPLPLWRGNAFSRQIRFKDSAGVALDLTGRPLTIYLEQGEVRLTLTPGDGVTLLDQAVPVTRGSCLMSLTKLQVALFAQGPGRYEVELDDETWLYGELKVGRWTAAND